MRLIDADALLEKMKKTDRYFNIKFDIEEAPTVDAEPIVRCRDCYLHGTCKYEQYLGLEGYCSKGE